MSPVLHKDNSSIELSVDAISAEMGATDAPMLLTVSTVLLQAASARKGPSSASVLTNAYLV